MDDELRDWQGCRKRKLEIWKTGRGLDIEAGKLLRECYLALVVEPGYLRGSCAH